MLFDEIKNQVRQSVTPFDLLTDIGLDTDCDFTFRFCERIRERLVINESRRTNDTPKNNGKRVRGLRVPHGGGDAGPPHTGV
jgi:hypothetical protein